MDDKSQSKNKKNDDDQVSQQQKHEEDPKPPVAGGGGGGGDWGGWGFSPLSFISDLQKAAAVAAEEISRNAAAVAQTASKSIAELQNSAEDSEPSKEDEGAEADKESEDEEDDKLRTSALDKLEKASEESLLSQGLKVFDNSVETFASGAWNALGSAFRGGTGLVHRLENSASNLAGSAQHDGPGAAGSNAPSLLETGKAFTAKGMQVLEYVGKETMDLLISETGIEVEKAKKEGEEQNDEDQLLEEVTFDRCFYIYGGPEQLEELEALSSHYALLFNRRKAKLSAEQKSVYDGKLKEVQQIFNLSTEIDRSSADSNKGKTIERGNEGSGDEMKNLHDSSVGKAAEMAAGFTNALAGLAANDIIQRTAARLESLHSEGVHRLSEMCCFAVSQLLMLGKSIISRANKSEDEEADDNKANIEWPEDVSAKAKIIRINAQTMIGYVEAVSNSFITGISDVTEAYQAAIKGVAAESHTVVPQTSVQEKASAFSEHLRDDQTTAISKIQDGMQFLAHVVLSTSMNAA
ncbi:uncharacterized protein LOC133318343 [Gastrolobium bilobum]|uniref:uncharacterized protein LOC133318343 n=1 Tax=Gastrolobium bilobum TaxID=150636 RepID=UPI002AB1676D|nr:uncharacterized protein LOC133318343 [Gastrolobium bilobum]